MLFLVQFKYLIDTIHNTKNKKMAQFLSCSLLSLILALTNSLSFGQTPFRFHFETVAGNMAELKNLNIADIDNAAFADLRRAYEQVKAI